jgi:putative methyltransferase (TIGR04325 family)
METVVRTTQPALRVDAEERSHAPESGIGWGLCCLRLAQVRATSALMRGLTSLGPVAALVGRVRKWPVARQAINLMAGYNRVFADRAAARKLVQRYYQPGHDSAEDTRALVDVMAKTRPSDYPVLLHLSRLSHEGLRVFDLGGTLGNVFFLYDRYLQFPASLRWTVHDLPGNMERGRELARQRCEPRLQFAEAPNDASGHDVLLISGALHYFDFALADYIIRLPQPPRHVFINRTPLVEAPTAATIQYTPGVVMVPCRLLNRKELIGGMERIGYEVVDSWRVPELSIKLPYDPEYWVREYSGLYFRSTPH